MKSPAPICAGLVAALVACSGRESPVALGLPEFAEAATLNETVPFTMTIVQPCTRELTLWSGQVHVKDHLTLQPDGSSNTETTINTQNTQAEGLVTGARYIAGEEFSTKFQDIPPGSTFSIEENFHMIRSGETGLLPDDDFRFHQIIHFTVNANGTLTANNFEARAECM